MTNLYIIGGSPCGGKSTVAQALADAFDLLYFPVDDSLDKYTQLAADAGCPYSRAWLEWTADQYWMRDPAQMCTEEFLFYQNVFPFLLADIRQLSHPNGIITEGAAWVPKLAHSIGIDARHYLCLTPTEDFQLFHYRKRTFVPYILRDCTDPEAAFSNWMRRDMAFARQAEAKCPALDYRSIVNDGSTTIEQLIQQAAEHFQLKR